MSGWIETYSGHAFYPMNPTQETIDIIDIAHALSMNCRYNGHCNRFYSVAEHSVVMSQNVDPRFALQALLHDAAEAYICDIPRPLKPLLRGYQEQENRLLEAIYIRFGVVPTDESDAAVHEADMRMLATEKPKLIGDRYEWPSIANVLPYEQPLGCWNPALGEAEFLFRFGELNLN